MLNWAPPALVMLPPDRSILHTFFHPTIIFPSSELLIHAIWSAHEWKADRLPNCQQPEGASRTILGPFDGSDIIIAPLNQGKLAARLRRPVQLCTLRQNLDGNTAIGDARHALVPAIWSLEGSVSVIHRDDHCCARQARQRALAGHEGSLTKAVLDGRVNDLEAGEVSRGGLAYTDRDVVLGGVYRVQLRGRLDLRGE